MMGKLRHMHTVGRVRDLVAALKGFDVRKVCGGSLRGRHLRERLQAQVVHFVLQLACGAHIHGADKMVGRKRSGHRWHSADNIFGIDRSVQISTFIDMEYHRSLNDRLLVRG